MVKKNIALAFILVWRLHHIHRFIIKSSLSGSRDMMANSSTQQSAITYYANTYTLSDSDSLLFTRSFAKMQTNKNYQQKKNRSENNTHITCSGKKTHPGGIGDSIEWHSPLHVLSFYSNSFLLYT